MVREKPKGPWYRQWAYWSAEANRYLGLARALATGSTPAAATAELRSYALASVYRVVFESNRIERAGLGRGETTRLIVAANSDLPLQDALPFGAAVGVGEPRIVSFRGRKRGEREVLQHAQALAVARGRDRLHAREWRRLAEARANPRSGTHAFVGPPPAGFLFDFDLKYIHQVMMDGLLPDDAEVAAGEYRSDSRTVGEGLVLPAPELVPAAMERYLSDGAARLVAAAGDPTADAVLLAARMSYEFVRIHPFPDGNGRLSRILMNLVLFRFGLPFWLALRGDSKNRKRYLRSLELANTGDLVPYAALIAMRLVESFEEIEDNLALAGHDLGSGPVIKRYVTVPPDCRSIVRDSET